jgi:hypothetical protein
MVLIELAFAPILQTVPFFFSLKSLGGDFPAWPNVQTNDVKAE